MAMKFRCLKCKTTWGTGNPKEEGYSDGFCKPCARKQLLHLLRKKQREQGNFDCFGKSKGFCDQINCTYRIFCVDQGGN